MKKVILIVPLLLPTPLLAQQQGGPDGSPRHEMLINLKQIKIDGIQGRMSILQTSLSCVNNAFRVEQIRSCEQQEHQAMEALSQQQKARIDALRAERFQGPGGPPMYGNPGGPPPPPPGSGAPPMSNGPGQQY